MAIARMNQLLQTDRDGLLPDGLARLAVKAESDMLLFFLQASCQEDAIPPDRRRGVPAAGDGYLPGDVLSRAPLERNTGLGGGAVHPRATPLRPIFGTSGIDEYE